MAVVGSRGGCGGSRAASVIAIRPTIASVISVVDAASWPGAARSAVRSPASSAAGDGRLDRGRDVLAAERPAGEHRRRQDRPDRVRDPAAGDVRRRAVDRLVHARTCRAPSSARRATPTAASRGCPRAPTPRRDRMSPKRFSVTIDVEPRRALDEEHRARVDELVVDLDVRVARLLSSSTTRRQSRDVARTLALSTLVRRPRRAARQLEAEPRRRAGSRPPCTAACRGRTRSPDRAGRLLALPEVDAAGQLADDQQVDAGEQLRPERRRRDERRDGS